MQATLSWKGQSFDCSALLDSGADENFLDDTIAKQLDLPSISLDKPLEASALDSTLLANITERTVPVRLQSSGNNNNNNNTIVLYSAFQNIQGRFT